MSLLRTKLKYRDTRRRIMKKEGGVVVFLLLRRLYCRKCRRLHIELPACLSPYKQYDVEVIEGVVDGMMFLLIHDDTASHEIMVYNRSTDYLTIMYQGEC